MEADRALEGNDNRNEKVDSITKRAFLLPEMNSNSERHTNGGIILEE